MSAPAPPAPVSDPLRRWAPWLFGAALALHAWFALCGLGAPLLGPHDFREAQTALATRELLRGGPFFAYRVPLFGPPWALPMEFPVFQTIVAAVAGGFRTPLDPTGRAVSLAAFYLCLPVLFALLARPIPHRRDRLLALALVVAAPTYLLWSRAFLVESTALLSSLLFLLGAVRRAEGGGVGWSALTVVAGIVAGLAKVTTFVVFLVPAGLMVLAWGMRWLRGDPAGRRAAVETTGAVAVAMAVAVTWARWAEDVRSANPLADRVVGGPPLEAWTFGPLAQRFDPSAWAVMLERSLPGLVGGGGALGAVALLAVACVLVATSRFRGAGAVCVAGLAAGPVVFTNMYVVHDYYFAATGVFAVLLVALGVLALRERLGPDSRAPLLVAAAVLAGQHLALQDGLAEHARAAPIHDLRVADRIAEVTPPESVILVYGDDWRPVLPYYADRPAVMDREGLGVDHPAVRAVLEELPPGAVAAVVAVHRETPTPPDVAVRTARRLGFPAEPVHADRVTTVWAAAGRGAAATAPVGDLPSSDRRRTPMAGAAPADALYRGISPPRGAPPP